MPRARAITPSAWVMYPASPLLKASDSSSAWDSGSSRYSAASKGFVLSGMSDLLCHRDGLLDVARLRGLVAAAEQDDENPAASNEIDAIARPLVDPQLADAIEKLGVAEQTRLKANEPL